MQPYTHPFACYYESPLGPMLLLASQTALHAAWFLGQKHFPAHCLALAEELRNNNRTSPLLQQACKELQLYFTGTLRSFSIPLQPQGTLFQERVWHALLALPYGTTQTYSHIAYTLGIPKAVRAVGGAIGKNPLSLFVPCHRIVGKSGKLTGYAGGLHRKEKLLSLEAQIPAGVF